MSFDSTDILYFKEYTFNDTGDVARHFGLVIVPPRLTEFKSSIYCAVITSKKPRVMYHAHTLDQSNYDCFDRETYIRLRDLDYVPENGLDKSLKQPVGVLLKSDAKQAFKKLKGYLFNPSNPIDKYLRAAVIREWKKVLK